MITCDFPVVQGDAAVAAQHRDQQRGNKICGNLIHQ